MSMSALPTGDEGRSQVVGSRVSTLPRGATTNGDEYTVMEVGVIVGGECVYDVKLVLIVSEGGGWWAWLTGGNWAEVPLHGPHLYSCYC